MGCFATGSNVGCAAKKKRRRIKGETKKQKKNSIRRDCSLRCICNALGCCAIRQERKKKENDDGKKKKRLNPLCSVCTHRTHLYFPALSYLRSLFFPFSFVVAVVNLRLPPSSHRRIALLHKVAKREREVRAKKRWRERKGRVTKKNRSRKRERRKDEALNGSLLLHSISFATLCNLAPLQQFSN